MTTSRAKLPVLLSFLALGFLQAQDDGGQSNHQLKQLSKVAPDPQSANKIVVPPLPAGNKRLDEMRKRSKALLEQRAAYLKKVAEGKIDPHANLRKLRPQHQRQLTDLQNSLKNWRSEKNSAQREILEKALLVALQPVGPYLEHASVGDGYINLLTEKEQAAMVRLDKLWESSNAGPAKASPFLMGPGEVYTLTKLSVPLVVRVAPSATVYFRSHGGGEFPNGIATIAVKADQNGIASTRWITHGDSVGDSMIGILADGSSSMSKITITTVGLNLIPLPEPKKLPAAPKVPNALGAKVPEKLSNGLNLNN